MKLPDTISEWGLVSVLLIPHTILIAFVSSGSSECDFFKLIGIHSFKDITDIIYNLAATMASIVAFFVYKNWRHEKQAEWDRDVKERITPELLNAADFLYELTTIMHELDIISLQARFCIENNINNRWPPRPKDHDFQKYLDKFCNQKRISLIAKKHSASTDYISAIDSFEISARKLEREIFHLHTELRSILDDDLSTPIRKIDLEKLTKEENLRKIKDMDFDTNNKLRIVMNFRPFE